MKKLFTIALFFLLLVSSFSSMINATDFNSNLLNNSTEKGEAYSSTNTFMIYGNYHKVCVVRLAHLSTGHVVECDRSNSQHKNRKACYSMLKGILYAKLYGPQQLVRSYIIPDGAPTIPELETGSCIDNAKRNKGR